MTNKTVIYFISFLFLICLPAVADKPIPARQAKCLKAGGEWGSWTKYEAAQNIKTCRIKAKDAGKPCNDGKDCSTNQCEFNPETKTVGCSEYAGHAGCHTWVKNDKPEDRICVD